MIARIFGIVDPAGGSPDGPAAAKRLADSLESVPPRIISKAGKARIETRCMNAKHDKVCGNESAMYPPLARDVKATAAATVEHSYSGTGFNETWNDQLRRGAYVGTFEIK